MIPGTKSPSLYKAGAEKICLAYGLIPHISMESKIEEWQKGEKGEQLFFGLYTMKCELHKIGNNGTDYVIASGYGSANTFEKRNGWNKGRPDAINSSILSRADGTVLDNGEIAVLTITDEDIENIFAIEEIREFIVDTILGYTDCLIFGKPLDPISSEEIADFICENEYLIAQKCGKQVKIVVRGRLGHREAFAVTLTDRCGDEK